MGIRKPKVKLTGVEALPPERVKELEAQATEIILNGRPVGQFSTKIKQELNQMGKGAPMVLMDDKLGTQTVPANFEGLIVHLAFWDSMLLPEELSAIRAVVEAMVPMGLNQQKEVRKERGEAEDRMAHMKEHHPSDWDKMQGWRV